MSISKKAMLCDFAEKNGLLDYEYYVDDGYTGRNFNHPSFQQMIANIEAGRVKCVITKDLSRLVRNYIEADSYIEVFFPRHNVCCITVDPEMAPTIGTIYDLASNSMDSMRIAKHLMEHKIPIIRLKTREKPEEYRVCLVDATNSKPGSSGVDYRLHYLIELFDLTMAEIHLTSAAEGETMTR